MKLKNLRILHLGNIANNAYLNAKFLRQRQVKADVISHDYNDPVATPEWEDSSSRPSWFLSGSLKEIAKHFKYQDDFSYLLITKKYHLFLLNKLIGKINEFYFKILRKINPYFEYLTLPEYFYFKKLIRKFKKYFPKRKDKLTIEDILPYSKDVRVFKQIFNSYDIIQCYGTEPVYALLAHKRPYIAFEHGTLRDFPFENSPQGRLTALSYKMANLVFITNPDNIKAATKLGITKFRAIPHPIDDYWHLLYRKKKIVKQKKYQIFCPARHDWSEKKVEHFIQALALINPKFYSHFKVTFVEWGQDLEKSKKLIQKLNLGKLITWEKLLTRQELAYKLETSDIILDQIRYFGLGGITAESLLAGKPVLNSYNKKLCHWIFPDPPPIVCVFNTKEIVNNLNDLLANPQKIAVIGKAGKEWFEKYHSKKIVLNILIESYEKITHSSYR